MEGTLYDEKDKRSNSYLPVSIGPSNIVKESEKLWDNR